ncbi:MAG: radical SAM protein [Nitrospirota bacterium]
MKYFLSESCALKRLETPSVYNISTDELYELDEAAFEFLKKCAGKEGSDGEKCDREFLDYAMNAGIISEKQSGVRRPPLVKAPAPSLRYLELQITRACNLRCRHCYIGPPDTLELSLEKIRKTLDEFLEMQGLRLLITGGEPLLHREFGKFNGLLHGYAFRKILFTNGLLLTRGILKALNVDEIQVSIDGLEQGHEALRGKGTFRKTMDAIRMALDSGFAVSISTMVHSANLYEFGGMERLFREMGIREWTVDSPCFEGNLRDNPAFQLSPEIAGKYLRYGFGEGLHDGGDGFGCGLHLASIMADGMVAKCSFYSDVPAGNVDEGLALCWSRIPPVRLNELKCDCEFIDICRGGCRFRAGLLGDVYGKDLYRCFAILKP